MMFATTLCLAQPNDSIVVNSPDTNRLTNNVIDSAIEAQPNRDSNGYLSELDYYRLILQEAKSSNQIYVSLIQWVIGISFALLLAIIGSQIFFNYRINKKEIEYIKKDIDEKLVELKSSLDKSIEDKFNVLKKEFVDQFNKNENQLSDKLEKKFSTLERFTELEIKLVEGSMNQKIKGLEKETEKNSGDIWKLKGVESNALSNFIRSAIIEIDLKQEVKYTLNEIIGLLSNIEEVNTYDYERLESLIDKIKVSHSAEAEKIKSLYKDKPVFEYVNAPRDGFGFSLLGLPRREYIKNKK